MPHQIIIIVVLLNIIIIQMTEQLKSLYQPENTVAAVSAGEKLKEAFSEVTVSFQFTFTPMHHGYYITHLQMLVVIWC